jgi:hypothetical protein
MNVTTLLLKSVLRQKIEWRRRILIAHGDDQRNHHAIKILTSLLQAPDDTPTDVLMGFRDTELRAAASDVSYRIGFRFFPSSMLEFIDLVAQQAEAKRAEHEAMWNERVAP